MKTQKEMIELLAESNLFNSMDYDIQDEYPTFDTEKDDVRVFIIDQCMDGKNIFDYLPLAIDQCLSKEDGIALIDEILSALCEQENELKLALEDAIDQLHYLDRNGTFYELRYSTRKSIINLRTQLERLFPDSKLIEKYKEVTLD